MREGSWGRMRLQGAHDPSGPTNASTTWVTWPWLQTCGPWTAAVRLHDKRNPSDFQCSPVGGREAGEERRKEGGKGRRDHSNTLWSSSGPNLRRRRTTRSCCLEGRGQLLGPRKPAALPLPPPLPTGARVPASRAKPGVDCP